VRQPFVIAPGLEQQLGQPLAGLGVARPEAERLFQQLPRSVGVLLHIPRHAGLEQEVRAHVAVAPSLPVGSVPALVCLLLGRASLRLVHQG